MFGGMPHPERQIGGEVAVPALLLPEAFRKNPLRFQHRR
jgi:hypothetical protein